MGKSKNSLWLPFFTALLLYSILGHTQVYWPLRVSGNGHFLEDQRGVPFLPVADTGWGIKKLSKEEVAHYLDTRKAQGFNTILVYIQKEIGDPKNPNQEAFDHLKFVSSECLKRGMLMALNTGWFGLNSVTLLPQFKAMGNPELTSYGRYLAKQFQDNPNMFYIQGGDANPEKDGAIPEIKNIVEKIHQGIAEVSPEILHTYHTTEPIEGSGVWSSSSTWFHKDDYIQVHGSQVHVPGRGYEDLYRLPLSDYKLPNPKPHFHLEPGYEEQRFALEVTPYYCRMGALWPLLSGSCAISYGHGSIWNFKKNWKSKLHDKGATHVTYIANWIRNYEWEKLVPDGAHNIIIDGYGTWYNRGNGKERYDYVTVAGASDRSFAVAYVPSRRDITIDLNWFSTAGDTVGLKWYDPTTRETYIAIPGTPFKTSGTKTLQMPMDNSWGDEDWVLIAQVASQ